MIKKITQKQKNLHLEYLLINLDSFCFSIFEKI
jgi:hypothetical protein